ncbi:hypothetical protein VP168E361_P0031 [Vibrio phage 168E36-1]|nr:hypothetical protein VP168E361_P0031 [Vibrio phage 168E36-1]
MTNKQIVNRAQRDLGTFNASLNPNGNRATGRTFRMVLSAVLACSGMRKESPRTIYIIGNDSKECRRMHYIASSILETVGGTDTVVDEICLPNGSRLLFRSRQWHKRERVFITAQERTGDKVFIDHYALEYKG